MNGNRPRVLFFSHETTLSGAPMQLLHLLPWLRHRGWAIAMAAPEPGPISELLAAEGITTVVDEAMLTEPSQTRLQQICAKFDVVVANPPFSLDKWGAESAAADKYTRFYRGVPPKSKADYAFISHMVETTVEGTGKVGVIAPHGVLFRGGAEGKIRKRLIEENLLEAVIGLPATSIEMRPSCGIRRSAMSRSERILTRLTTAGTALAGTVAASCSTPSMR